MTPVASVIVPTYGDWDGLADCLACLEAQTAPAASFEVVVGNNNPEPDPPPGLRLPANARMVWAPTPGSYAARNAAVAVAEGRVLFFTDSDCRPAPDWIEAGLAALAARPGADRLAGRIEMTPAGADWTAAELHDSIFELQQPRYVRKNYAATANLVVLRELFDRTGGFDESLFSSGDKEWNGRAAAFGGRIRYAPEVVVRHPARGSFEALARKRIRVVGGRFATRGARKWRNYVTLLKFLLPAPAALVRIAGHPGLTPGMRLRVALLDYRLRLVEFRTLAGLRYAAAGATRS